MCASLGDVGAHAIHILYISIPLFMLPMQLHCLNSRGPKLHPPQGYNITIQFWITLTSIIYYTATHLCDFSGFQMTPA